MTEGKVLDLELACLDDLRAEIRAHISACPTSTTLPGVQEMKAASLLDLSIPVGFEVPGPSRASDGDDELLMPGEDDGPDFVSED